MTSAIVPVWRRVAAVCALLLPVPRLRVYLAARMLRTDEERRRARERH